MARIAHHFSDAVHQGLRNAEHLLKAACSTFVSSPMVQRDIGMTAAASMQAAISRGDLNAVSGMIRRSICVCSVSHSFDSTLYWAMIDSIGFFYDAHPGAWPYVDSDGCLRYIAWSLEGAKSVVDRLH